MNSKKIWIASAAVLFFGNTEAQQTAYYQKQNHYLYDLAENLYQTRVFAAAQYGYSQHYFYDRSLSESRKEAARFFDNVIGVILQRNKAEEGLEAFMKAYPQSAYFSQASLPLADYYLVKKDFALALQTLQSINQYQLSREENTEYILKLGYAKFMTGDTKGATEALEEAYKQADEQTRADLSYMLGHLYYADGQNDKAFGFFDTIKSDIRYTKLVQPYYVQLYYNEKNYDKAIEEGSALLNENLPETYRAEVHKIIGESYFMKEDYASAYPHLKVYLQSQQEPSESDLYEMGFVASQLQKYDEAVTYYNRLTNSRSAMSQNAYYQLGNAYLLTGKKQEALSAFRSAYQMTYDTGVQKLAHEQYAKLSYDIGNPFESAPATIQEYLQRYPQSEKNNEMKSLLVKSYLYSGNYKETLAAIDKLPDSTPEIDQVDQEVSFLLGTEEFNKGNYDEAERYFLRSLETRINQSFYPRALYWLAQTYYQKGNYPSAIVRFEKLKNETFEEKKQLNYDLGYAYFKSGKFGEAQTYFKAYLADPDPEFKKDAELRLADTYYASNQLNEAIAIYDKTEGANDYTLFQKGLALGFKGDSLAKIETLKRLVTQHPTSDYADDALYEIGVAYASNEDYTSANDYFTKVVKSSTDKDLVANAQIYRAQNYIDQNQESKALAELRSLGNQYKNTAYASRIAQTAKPIFIKNGDVSGYQTFAQNIGIRVNASDIDEIHLASARQFYAKKEYKNAIPLYEKYLTQNPTGETLYQAQYELGESLYQMKNTTKALLVLQEVAAVQNDYQQEAQTRLAQIHLAQGTLKEAQKYLEALAASSNATLRNFSHIELMKLFAEEQNLPQAEKYADLVMAYAKNPASVIENAKVIKARSLMKRGKDQEAQSAYLALEKASNPTVTAEALYAKAYYQNRAKAFKSSNETIFRLANNYASEDYWGAKALVVMAKNYLGLKDKYQASYTVDQILANYQDFPDVIAEAKEVKKQIK
ncbi:tetratricopeptide repeat protein [Bergeyella sp. RCAD1439]|uniref:tetratricopeptide repeat protein n=1 Tax=Bergeyella anatis TaxID=3113737 RepID=UPI002E173701|nr:tetratricopeptide repeat protein [Bergeyella sp. RCAD1439]